MVLSTQPEKSSRSSSIVKQSTAPVWPVRLCSCRSRVLTTGSGRAPLPSLSKPEGCRGPACIITSTSNVKPHEPAELFVLSGQ